jgi:vacuolar protein sorting-associated protein 13A/C
MFLPYGFGCMDHLFLQITAYFMELATPNTEEAIKLVDKVGGFEWLIQKYEIDGATALKLDLSLDTPIIIVPRNSMSKEYVYFLFMTYEV